MEVKCGILYTAIYPAPPACTSNTTLNCYEIRRHSVMSHAWIHVQAGGIHWRETYRKYAREEKKWPRILFFFFYLPISNKALTTLSGSFKYKIYSERGLIYVLTHYKHPNILTFNNIVHNIVAYQAHPMYMYMFCILICLFKFFFINVLKCWLFPWHVALSISKHHIYSNKVTTKIPTTKFKDNSRIFQGSRM